MFLDLGQKTFGATKQCQKCGMFYILGDFEDEKRHKSFCEQSQKSLLLKGNIDERQIVETLRGEDLGSVDDRIILIRGARSSKQKIDAASLNHILETVQAALGSSLDLMESAEESCLLYIRNKEVLGCIIVEPVAKRCLVSITNTMKTTDVNVKVETATESKHIKRFGKAATNIVTPVTDKTQSAIPRPREVASNAKENIKPQATQETDLLKQVPPGEGDTMGVKLVWVDERVRRKGVARRMLDCARKHFRFGMVISKDHVAFSQPTDQGLAFALSYTRRNQIWSFC